MKIDELVSVRIEGNGVGPLTRIYVNGQQMPISRATFTIDARSAPVTTMEMVTYRFLDIPEELQTTLHIEGVPLADIVAELKKRNASLGLESVSGGLEDTQMNIDRNNPEVIEALAAYAHAAWSGWMKYMFSRCGYDPTRGTMQIPRDLVERWQRQASTDYNDLPESEKESDRDEARKMLAVLQAEDPPVSI